MTNPTVGSICSGIEAASVAWKSLDFEFKWFSEIAPFPSKLLSIKYPNIPNLGNMNCIPELLATGEIATPDIICGGTPCQAFSFAGHQKGLHDDRGNLTLKFVDIVEQNDEIRIKNNQPRAIIFWENVVGILSDKTNAFGCFISSLAGLSEILKEKWTYAGYVKGPKRTVVWRVLDAKYFGIPQQRKRLYVIAGEHELHPENILFEEYKETIQPEYTNKELTFEIDGHLFEIFRAYTDCLFSSYATKWNGNAAANNGSLFVVQDERLRRLSPLECERLMGFPDNYTNISGATKSNRYNALGNSWAVPVVEWIGNRIKKSIEKKEETTLQKTDNHVEYRLFKNGIQDLNNGITINCSEKPSSCVIGDIKDILSPYDVPDIYLSPVGCAGIIRRSQERNTTINPQLFKALQKCTNTIPEEEIERRSQIQKRGKYSN